MLKSEVLDFRTKTVYNISYFEDDDIDMIRHYIAIAMNTHPDRLFILVSLSLNHDYYQKDPRRWENLFYRLSYDGKPIKKEIFSEYQSEYRSPEINVSYDEYDKTEWMSKPESLAEFYSPTRDFSELRIFGVEDEKSYILPFDFNSALTSKIPAATLPNPQLKSLCSTMYNTSKINRFVVIPYESTAENAQLVYFPYLRSNTPNILNDEIVSMIEKNKNTLKDLLEYKVNEPTKVSIQRARFKTDLVETDFGNAVRTRFEQIFYGMTLSEEIPYIGLFTGKEVMRHKFYVKDSKKEKKPFLDLNIWKRWDSRRPSRNIPILVLFRGTDKEIYDRIAISEKDIVMTFYRDESNKSSIDELKREGIKWLKQFDALSSFLNKNDIDLERWEIDEMEIELKYFVELKDIEHRRLNCVSSLFNQPKIDEPKFNFLRTDHTNYGISPIEIKVIQMRENGDLTPTALAKELNISNEKARTIIQDVERRIEMEPNLALRAFRNFPSITFKDKTVTVSFVTELDRIIKYTSLLRYIITSNDSKLDKICPKRLEIINSDTGTPFIQKTEVDEATRSQFGDLFAFLEEEEEPVEKEVEVSKPKDTKTKLPQKRKTMYSYFKDRLDAFDPATFNPPVKGFKYTKECEFKKQPVILSEKDLEYLKEDGEYDPRTYMSEKEMMNTYDPDGLIICPEYWCMKDQIPLTEEQLDKEDGEIKCPVCSGKLRTSISDDPRQYTVIKRDSSFRYPGPKKTFRSLNKNEPMPCCFETPQNTKVSDTPDKYYVNRESIANLKELRVAFLSRELLSSLQIDEQYDLLSGTPKRLQTGMSAFFRVGIGRPSETLPEILQLKLKVPPPLESIETVLKCSFLRTWKDLNDSHIEEIENKLEKILPANQNVVKTNLSKIISGIHSAFMKKELSILQELEYTCLFLQSDVFRIYTSDNKLGCLFYSPIVKPRTRGIIILQTDKAIDILCHVTRLPRGFEYRGNVFNSPFKKETYTILEKLRNKACQTKVPSSSTALSIAKDILTISGESDFQVILDPYGRAQAFFIPRNMFIPFQPTSNLIDMTQPKIMGYVNIELELYPRYDKVKEYLEVARKYNETYEIEDELFNSKNQRVEILLKSGLRIPVYPDEKSGEPTEVIETTNTIGEPNLVFGEESKELKTEYSKISYASEVYDFLLYELTYDLKEEYSKLRSALSLDHPKQKDVEPLLKKWFEEKIEMTKATSPVQFVSKIRKPCGQFKTENTCSGNLCAWDGKTCKVEVKQSVRKDNLFYRILTTLIENSKIRAMILDGRTAPFFSTVLYLEMPNELILTDSDIVNINV